jgi:EmrB/QacA subfamily drug resistance transporter
MVGARRHHNATLAVLTLAATAYALQQTMVVPALPTLQRELDTSTTWVTWVFTGFLLSAAVCTPILGKLGDRFGKERLLVLSLCVFFFGTIGCAAAWNIGSLIAFRAASGAGAAVFPLSFGIIRDEFPPEKMKVGMGLLSAVFGIGGGLGLVFAGLIIDNLSWRWLFIAGAVPVGVAVLLVHKLVPESPVRSKSRIDLVGATLLSGTLVALLVALSEGETWGWTSARTLGLLVASIVLGTAFALAELRVSEPLIDMKVFVERPVLLTNITALIAGFAMFGAFSLLPRFIEAPAGLPADVAEQVQYGFAASATRAGLYLVPSSVMMLFAGPIAGLLGRRFGSKWPLCAGMLFVALGAVLLGAWHDHPWQIVIAMGALGTGIAFAFASMAALITEAVAPTETGIATGINTVMRTIGAVIGGQVGAAVLTSSTIAGTSVPTESAYATTFYLSCGAALIAAGIAVFVTRRGRAPTPAWVAPT